MEAWENISVEPRRAPVKETGDGEWNSLRALASLLHVLETGKSIKAVYTSHGIEKDVVVKDCVKANFIQLLQNRMSRLERQGHAIC